MPHCQFSTSVRLVEVFNTRNSVQNTICFSVCVRLIEVYGPSALNTEGSLELARLVSSLLYGTRTMLVLSLPAFENKKYTAYDRFHENGPYGEIPTEKEPIRRIYLAI